MGKRARRAGVAFVFGPLMFIHGAPELGPHEIDVPGTVGALLGTAFYAGIIGYALGVFP